MIKLFLNRKKYTDKQVIGVMDVLKNNEFVCSLAILEQEDRNNEIGNSCIPKGVYNVEQYHSNKYPDAFIVKGTHPRTKILIHNGNYHTHTEGCLLLGYHHIDINNDGYSDVIHSKTALNRLYAICRDENEIILDIS